MCVSMCICIHTYMYLCVFCELKFEVRIIKTLLSDDINTPNNYCQLYAGHDILEKTVHCPSFQFPWLTLDISLGWNIL